MPKRIEITFFLLFVWAFAEAQEPWSYPVVDRNSYALYQQQKWEELILYSTEARKNGIDFFYLQARTGIAWYNLGKYRSATEWFLKSWESDKSFSWLQEYLYYSLLFSGRTYEASKIAQQFTPELKEKVNFQDKGITRIAYETGFSFNPSFTELANRDFAGEVEPGTDYGEGYFLKNYSFHSIDLSHKLSPNLILNHTFTCLGVNRETWVTWVEQTSSPIKVRQFQYFINPIWVLGKRIHISPSLAVIYGKGEVYAGRLNNNLERTWSLTKINYDELVFSTSVWGHFKNISPGIEINAGTVNDSKFTQLSPWITWYPFSTTHFYITPRIYFKTGTETEGLELTTLGISGGFQLGPVHFNGQYLTGNMKNFIESAGYVIYNFPGKAEQKISGSFYFPFGKKYQFVLRYINQDITETYQIYTGGIKSNSLEYTYLQHTITGGISWNF